MRVLATMFTLVMFSGTALAADGPADSLNTEVVRFLHAWGFGKEVKAFFAKAVSRGALDEKTGRAIAQLSEHRYAELGAPVARTPKQAAVVEQYIRSSAPQTTARLRDAMRDPAFADQFNAALEQELQQSADSK